MERRIFLKGAAGLLAVSMASWPVAAMSLGEIEPAAAPQRLLIVGLGGVGCRIVSRLAREGGEWDYPDLCAIDTDRSALDQVDARVSRIWLPVNARGEEGSCIYPHVARRTAWMHRDRVAHVWQHDEIFIFVAGLGQGAGTGFAQAFSWQARQAGAYPATLIQMPCAGEIHPVPLEPEVRRLERAAEGFGRYMPEDHNPDALVKDVYKACEDRLVWELRTL